MKRRKFLLSTSTIALLSPLIARADESWSFEELTGQKTPALFGDGYRLRKEASEAFAEMKSEATQAGFDIYSVSSYRSFSDQKRIWNNKYDRFTKAGDNPEKAIKRIIEYSTIPGTSRHHWGTDIDIVDNSQQVDGDRLLSSLFSTGKPYGPFKQWLNEKAQNFDFFEVYTNKPERKGFYYEPWHFSYKPLSQPFLKAYMKIDFKSLLRGLEINGNSHLSDNFIDQYWQQNMLDINPQLLP